jgi:hypothetical protein
VAGILRTGWRSVSGTAEEDEFAIAPKGQRSHAIAISYYHLIIFL